ncbi:MAG TPA: molybdopterin-dependent oxidoreductase, partial [Thermoanaerobaculia bacterium]
EKAPKPLPACATPVTNGMKVFTHSDQAITAQKGVMEFLLINHPLDCPICDQGGECDLQDQAMAYGFDRGRFAENKRAVKDKNLGPLVKTEMNRCIHCTRCIRFTAEITGTSELAFFKRGASTEVGVYPGTPLDNWMSACVTDICPTGALTPREFRFESRVWNLDSTESVCNGCDVGCNLFIGHRSGQVFRYRPRVNPEVNDHWLCDYGRFSYEQYETDRVVVPKVRTDDDYLAIATWQEALESIEKGVKDAKNIVVIASAQMTNEEAWMAKTLFGKLNAKIGVMVDPIGPIRMKSRTEWIIGDQAGPNFRGVRAVVGDASIEELLTSGADGIDVLYILDARFSERTKDPAVVANLRKAKFLVVHSWEADQPLTEVADVLIPGATLPEKEGTFTNLQGRVQRIHQAYQPKGQAVTDLEALRRVGARLFPNDTAFGTADALDVFASLRAEVPEMAEVSA